MSDLVKRGHYFVEGELNDELRLYNLYIKVYNLYNI